MIGKVISLDDHRPHFMFPTDSGATVLPTTLVWGVVYRRQPLSALGDEVLRCIVEEWAFHQEGR